MALSQKQQGVLKGMMLALLVSVLALLLCFWFMSSSVVPILSWEHRFAVLRFSYLLILIPFAISIIRLAKHRFFCVQDIDAAVGKQQSATATLLQSILQNTLEQTVLAAFTYFVWVSLLPLANIDVIYVASLLFFLGRVLFIAFYDRGAVARSFGFALSFYPTMLLLLICVVTQILRF